jgi:hypothetical protein
LIACPHFKKENENIITCAKSAFDGLLESPLNFPSIQKVSKIQLQIGIVVACPKSLNSIYGSHSPLGVNVGNKNHTLHCTTFLSNVEEVLLPLQESRAMKTEVISKHHGEVSYDIC